MLYYYRTQTGMFMSDYQQELIDYLNNLSEELGCSVGCAGDVWYLRQRSRWTQELENELISLHNAGNPPNINEFPTA